MYIWIPYAAPAAVLEDIDVYCGQHSIHIQDQRLYIAHHDLEPCGWQLRVDLSDSSHQLDLVLLKWSEWVVTAAGPIVNLPQLRT